MKPCVTRAMNKSDSGTAIMKDIALWLAAVVLCTCLPARLSAQPRSLASELDLNSTKSAAPANVPQVARAPLTWSFRNHVIPTLTKVGCNSGACHGALAGKGGLKLSLRGYAPEVDHFVLTRQAL